MKMLKEGKVLLSEFVAVTCCVRDITAGGARLEFDGPICLPDEFRLRIVSADLTIPATVCWQRRLEAGIRFTGIGKVGQVNQSTRPVARSAA
jgi:hypothetical protein